MKNWTVLFFLMMVFPVAAQTAGGDTSRTGLATGDSALLSLKTPRDTLGELVMEEIEIIGKVEKPSVIIVPKRMEPEIEDAELERSFQQEVKEGVGEIPKPTEELQKVDPVRSIKKTVVRKRK